jgi:hypothetical protein
MTGKEREYRTDEQETDEQGRKEQINKELPLQTRKILHFFNSLPDRGSVSV